VVLIDKIGVVNVFPLAIEVPPVALLYQVIVPEEAVACNVTVPLPHLTAGMTPVTAGVAVTVAVMAVLLLLVQLLKVAST
jgi:hypothetical protein